MSSALVESLAKFLHEEESFVQQSRAMLVQARNLLSTPKVEASDRAVRIQQNLLQAVEARRIVREAWWSAARQESPTATTLSELILTFPEPTRKKLQTDWRRIQQDSRQFSAELKQFLAFVRASVDCYESFFSDLFRGNTTEGRYGPNGRSRPAANVVFVETRG